MSATMTDSHLDSITHRNSLAQQSDLQPVPDLQQYLKQYAKERPDVVALWCFGVGFVLGWKLKPW